MVAFGGLVQSIRNHPDIDLFADKGLSQQRVVPLIHHFHKGVAADRKRQCLPLHFPALVLEGIAHVHDIAGADGQGIGLGRAGQQGSRLGGIASGRFIPESQGNRKAETPFFQWWCIQGRSGAGSNRVSFRGRDITASQGSAQLEGTRNGDIKRLGRRRVTLAIWRPASVWT